jgi:peptidase E
MDWQLGPAYGLAASLAQAGDSPRVCLVGTGLGDAGDTLLAMYAAFGRAGWRVSYLALFPEPNVADVQEHLLAQDLVWVAGGSVANLLALWRLHGIGPSMHAAWQAGVVLMGVSAGSVCWFAGGTTDAFGLPLRPVTDALGFLPYSNSPHLRGHRARRLRD